MSESMRMWVEVTFNVAYLVAIWSLGRALYNSRSRDKATGDALDQIGSLIGVPRLGARASTATVTLTGTSGTIVPTGTLFEVTGSKARFALDAAVTLASGTGSGTVTAVQTGPIQAVAGTLTAIVNSVSGLSAVTNPADAVLGRAIETDAQYRVRQTQALYRAGTGTLAALLAELTALEDVEEVYVYENGTDTTDADGIPPHSFEAVLRLASGGSAQKVGETLWANKPAGIRAYGDTDVEVLDSAGRTQVVAFTEATERPVYIEAAVTQVDPRTFPADGAARIEAAILAAAADMATIGTAVNYGVLYAAIFSGYVDSDGVVAVAKCPGVKAAALLIGFSDPPASSSNLAIGVREIAIFETTRTVVEVP